MAGSRTDLRAPVERRRADYRLELRRRHVPRILLSDGTEPEAVAAAHAGAAPGDLVGTPASAGTATAPARIILDPVGVSWDTIGADHLARDAVPLLKDDGILEIVTLAMVLAKEAKISPRDLAACT